MDVKTEVASGFSVDRYNEIRPKLDPAHPDSESWEEVIAAFERRIRERYWDPIRKLEVDDGFTVLPLRPGFAIVALCCLLIETLNSFENGEPLPSRGPSKSKFIDFLKERLQFSDEDARSFYRNVRNKLLHDGETQQDWKIRRGIGYPIVYRDDAVRILNRVPFRASLQHQFGLYYERLRLPDEVDLRLRFNRRFSILCNTGDGE